MTRGPVAFTSVQDPLLRNPDLAHVVELPVLGLLTRFETNSEDVAAMVREDFAAWQPAMSLVAPEEPPLTVRIIVHGTSESIDGSSALETRSTADGRLIIHSAASVAIADPMRRESLAYVTADLVAQEQLFRERVLNAATFALLAAFDRHPVHAAGICHEGHALLLAGPGGSGKSTLACLAHLHGLNVMSDDLVWVQSEPTLRVWASTHTAHLRPDSLHKLAMTDMHPVVRHRDGKRRISLAEAGQREAVLTAEVARVCLLVPGTHAALEPVGATVLEAALADQLEPGFDRFPQRSRAVLRRLAAPGGWRLTLSREPLDALPFLEQMLGVTPPENPGL
jgi:hypothetical protein